MMIQINKENKLMLIQKIRVQNTFCFQMMNLTNKKIKVYSFNIINNRIIA